MFLSLLSLTRQSEEGDPWLLLFIMLLLEMVEPSPD